MATTTNRADRVMLHNISWQQFENLLQNLGEHRGARLAYDRGTLEIMTPLPEHEYYKEIISIIIQDIAEELNLNYESLGSITWRREGSMAGVEPDNCFYFQNEAAIRGRLDLDLAKDPPPDLVLEVDITNKSLNRFPIYARLGIPEIWCYQNKELKVYRLSIDRYTEVRTSLVFPSLPIEEIPNLIEQNRAAGRRAIRQAVRTWVKK